MICIPLRELNELLEEKLDGSGRMSVIKGEKIGELMEKMKMEEMNC